MLVRPTAPNMRAARLHFTRVTSCKVGQELQMKVLHRAPSFPEFSTVTKFDPVIDNHTYLKTNSQDHKLEQMKSLLSMSKN